MIPANRVQRLPDGRLILKPRLCLGLELEGMVAEEAYPAFRDHLRDLCGYDEDERDYRLSFGTDGSIKNVPAGFRAIEMRTTILPFFAGLRLFEEVLCFLYLASETGDWITNDSCGLHVNVSEKSVWRDGTQDHWYCRILSRFDEDGTLRRWGREGSPYCRAAIGPGESRSFDVILRRFEQGEIVAPPGAPTPKKPERLNGDKYLAVALRDQERVEFRCLGNTDYHLRHDDLRDTFLHIHECLKQSYREMAPTVESSQIES